MNIGLIRTKLENLRINLKGIEDGYLEVANDNWGNKNIFILL
jgi:hypothetical protein